MLILTLINIKEKTCIFLSSAKNYYICFEPFVKKK